MDLVTSRGARLSLTHTPRVAIPKGFRKGRGPLGVLLMCHLMVERPARVPIEIAAPIARLGEAHAMTRWLASVAEGTAHPATVPGAPALRFASPFLAMDLAALDGTNATFRVHLALPAPGASVSEVHDLQPLRLPMTVQRTVVAQAARDWHQEIPALLEEG